MINSNALIDVLDCDAAAVVNGRCTGKAASAVLDGLLIAVERERAMLSAELAESEVEATADNNAISVVVLSVMSPVAL